MRSQHAFRLGSGASRGACCWPVWPYLRSEGTDFPQIQVCTTEHRIRSVLNNITRLPVCRQPSDTARSVGKVQVRIPSPSDAALVARLIPNGAMRRTDW